MNPLPWLPMIVAAICGSTLPVAWWSAIDRQRWLRVRAYRRYRPGVRDRAHMRWSQQLLEMNPYEWEQEWECDCDECRAYEDDYDDYPTVRIESRVPRAEFL